MKRPCGLKIICFLMMLILLNTSDVGGQSVQRFFEWEPFKASIDLKLTAPSAILEYERLTLSNKASFQEEFFKEEMEVSNGNSERKRNIYYNQKISLYLSNLVMDQKNIDIQQTSANDSGALNTITSLSNMLLNSRYWDTFESIGKVFQLQLNLGIEF